MSTTTLERANIKERLELDGYVIVENVFDPAVDFAQLFSDFQEILDEIIEECIADGSLSNRYEGLPFSERFVKVCKESGKNFPGRFDIALPQKNIKADTPVYLGHGIFSVLTHERLLDAVEQILGPEITSNPIQHTRMKLPLALVSEEGSKDGKVAAHQFHQDQGVALPEADVSDILTCWIAVTDADEENDCLQIYPSTAHRGLIAHCPAGTPAMKGLNRRGIPPKLLPNEESTPVIIKAGSALFFKGQLVHGSHGNFSEDRLRISLDLRFQKSGFPTGRPGFPDFIARSRANPASEYRDADGWRDMWLAARAEFAGRPDNPYFYRWDANSADCS